MRRTTDRRNFTDYCLSSLNANGGALGSLLRKLHLYCLKMGYQAAVLSEAFSVCPSLVELKFVHMYVPLCRVLESVSRYCRLLESFILEFRGVCGTNYELESSVFKEFVLNCPKITTLTLQACGLLDTHAFELVKGFHNLKYVHFAGCHRLTGAFLKNLGTKGGANSLEVMILRQCIHLCKVEIENFLTALVAEKFKLLRHLDISESVVPVYEYYGYGGVVYTVSFLDIPIKKLLEHRPNFCLVIEYNKSD